MNNIRMTCGLAAFGFAALTALATVPVQAQDVLGTTGIKGAGSTFAYPILSRWSREYRQWQSRGGEFPAANSGLEGPSASTALDYEPVGSLAGTLRVKAREVDFGVSDVPMKSDELARLGLAQFPIVIGGVVAVVNLDGVAPGQIRLTGPLLADIFLGKVARWSDPAIRTLNPDLELPDAAIAVIHRADGSGTTFNLTDYLSKVSPQWSSQVGAGLLVPWPGGTGARGNEGMSQTVRQVKNSIGYVEYAQALKAKLSYAQLQNRAGNIIRPGPAAFQAAASNADWAATTDFHVLLTDAPGDAAYPIVATVFVLMPKAGSATRTAAALDFFRWSLQKGSKDAAQLGYVPLPATLVKQIERYWVKGLEAGV